MKPSLADPAALEAALVAALLAADISRGYEEFFAIIDSFYADDVEAASEGLERPVVGKRQLRNVVTQWLLPLHVMAEIGGLGVTLRRAEETRSDVRGTKHSTWALELIGVTGSRCSLTWSCVRTWKEAKVVSEYHYDYQRTGAPLGIDDVRFADQVRGGLYDDSDV
jgi:hypothetical protein